MRSAFLAACAAAATVSLCDALPAFAQDAPRASETGPSTPEASASLVPVLLHAGGQPLRVGEALCLSGTCLTSVPRGRLHLERQSRHDGTMTTDYETDIVVEGPSRISVEDSGVLHSVALGATVAGGAIVLAGLLVPLFVCRSSSNADGSLAQSNPCDSVSDGGKVGWIAGIGAGLTMAVFGSIGLAVTNRPTHASVRPWTPPGGIAIQPFLLPGAERSGAPVLAGLTLAGWF